MFFNCSKITRPNNRPSAQKANPIDKRLCPVMPKKCTLDRSGSTRLASPPPAFSCALANVGSSRPKPRTAATVLHWRFKKTLARAKEKAATSESALTARKKYTQYCAVTNPPKLKVLAVYYKRSG